jgi:hypothetical protein
MVPKRRFDVSISARSIRPGAGVEEPESVLEDRAGPVRESLGDASYALVR